MPPPPVPASRLSVQSHGPDIRVPNAWQNSTPLQCTSEHPTGRHTGSQSTAGSSRPSTPPMRPFGYSQHHARYPTHHQYWAGKAHQAPPSQTYALDLLAVYEAGGRKKNVRSNVFGVCKFIVRWIYI